MDKNEKIQYHNETTQYIERKKIPFLFNSLLEKLVTFQPSNIYDFLIEKVQNFRQDFTFFIFGDQDVLTDEVKELMTKQENAVYFNYLSNKHYEVLKSFLEQEGSKAKFVFNFPLDFETLIQFNDNSLYYDQIFYFKNNEEESEICQKIKQCFQSNVIEIQKEQIIRFMQIKLKMVNKQVKAPKILFLGNGNNSQKLENISKLMGLKYIDFKVLYLQFYSHQKSISKTQELQEQTMFALLQKLIYSNEYLNKGFILNIDLSYTPSRINQITEYEYDLVIINQIEQQPIKNQYVLMDGMLSYQDKEIQPQVSDVYIQQILKLEQLKNYHLLRREISEREIEEIIINRISSNQLIFEY